MFKNKRSYLNRRVFSTLTLSLFPFSAISPLFISRAARYTPSLQRQADEKNETNLVSINFEHLLSAANLLLILLIAPDRDNNLQKKELVLIR